MADYQPGVCNIGRTQRRLRLAAGVGSFLAAGALVGARLFGLAPAATVWAAAPFVFGGWLGVLQDRFRFCVAFAALARYDLSGSGGAGGRASDREAVRADRRRAIALLGYALGLTLVTVGTLTALLGAV
ncbi:hypothetical protein [Haloarcula litorea]|uniref:hypothetical protein n=1 Tax=Haloarcula litorea TaxID=3032579 RepID=UPI0023E8EC76|nr:hypothetical protein [Halomicroarcula sp. GDY20]